MEIESRFRYLLASAAVALATVPALALMALPEDAGATLAFTRNPFNSAVFVASDSGKEIRKIAAGRSPHVTPDGSSVIYFAEGPGHAAQMRIAPAAGGPSKLLMPGWREDFYVAISPDSTKVAALRGAELGKKNLVVIDIATGAQTVVARGFFSGFSFSPDSTELVYAKAGSESFPPRSDIFSVAVGGGKPTRLTSDRKSEDPLWGPAGKIVFIKLLDADRRKYGPKNELYLMKPNGKGVKRLTHTRVAPLLSGLSPVAWSANGARLLAQFGGQDTTYAVGVNVRTGAQKPIEKATEAGLVGTDLTADGKTVLGFTDGFEFSRGTKVVIVPFGGGKKRVLVRNAYEPSWNQ
jgi:Tol biopolymer transport system component